MAFSELDISGLEARARKLRCNIVSAVALAGSGHNGGSLSAIDVIAYLYFHAMRVDPDEPRWPDRDRFVLSKGHCCPALYVALAERGFFSEETLWTLRDIESPLQGHPDMNKTPGVDITTGSLGQGISCAVGMAIAGKLDGKGYRVYALVGDGELQEGLVWEAAMAAGHHGLDNLIVIVDNNKLETDGPTSTIVGVEPIAAKWAAFGWDVYLCDGHSFESIHAAIRSCIESSGRPSVVVADTIKGKGVRFMEGSVGWHSGPTTPEQTEQALREIMESAP